MRVRDKDELMAAWWLLVFFENLFLWIEDVDMGSMDVFCWVIFK